MARSKRRRVIFGRGAESKGTSGIIIEDEVSAFCKIASVNFPKEVDRAVRHVGFVIHKLVKKFMKEDKHGEPLSEIQAARHVDKIKQRSDYTGNRISGGRLRRKKNAGGHSNIKGRSLEQAVHFDHKRGRQKVIVGWASNDARFGSGKRFQEGSTVHVTKKMRKFFFWAASKARGRQKSKLLAMAGLPIGTPIKNPERKVFDPVFRSMMSKIPKILEARIEANMGMLEDELYNAILLSETGIVENGRRAKRTASKGRRRRAA